MQDIIEGDGVTLRRWRLDDRAAIEQVLARSKAEFADFLPDLPGELADAGEFLRSSIAKFDSGESAEYAVLDGGAVAGQCSIDFHDGGSTEIGYWISTERAGRGLATAAVRAVTAATFAGVPAVQRVEIRCDANNARSARVAEKAGFEHVETVDLECPGTGTPAQSGFEMVWVRVRPSA